MVSEDETVFIMRSGSIVHKDKGFTSDSEVEKYIEENLPAGDYRFGVLESTEKKFVEEDAPESKTYTQAETDRIENIKDEVENSDSIKSVSFYETEEQILHCSIHQNNIRYKEGEVDFKLHVDESLFDDPPVSTVDKSVEARIIEIFDTIACGVATYMGYDSSYAKRGRRKPYVIAYGRVHREDEDVIRMLGEEDYVDAVIRSSENMSPIPIYDLSEKENYLPQDYMVVLKVDTVTDSFDNIPDTKMNEVEDILNKIDDKYDIFQFDWIGRIPFKKDYSTIGVGVSTN